MDDSREFLSAGFEAVPPDHHWLIWTLPDKRSRWYHGGDINKALTDVEKLRDRDVYIAAGLSSKNRGAKKRVEAEEISGLIGLWADIDIAESGAHKKSNLPPTEADARAVLDAMGAPPTIIVHSGHGLQAWWLFTEPWIFESDEEREEAARLSIRWFATMKMHAAELGWVIDSTFDLARVMRLPGTTNRKALPVPVQIILRGGPMYDRDDFEQWIADEAALTLLSSRRTHHVGDLELRATAQPNIEKRDILAANDGRFTRTFERKRTDLADDSPSGYDMAMARLCARAGWSHQEIVDMLIYARRHNHEDLKLDRLDYYQRTIARAFDEEASTASLEALPNAREAHETAKLRVQIGEAGEEKEQHTRRALLDAVSDAVGTTFLRMLMIKSDPPDWQPVGPLGPMRQLSGEAIQSQVKFRAVVMDATKHIMPRFKPKEWDEILQSLASAAEDVDVGFEATDAGLAYTWLGEYLRDRQLLDNPSEAIESRLPYRDEDGIIYVIGDPMRKWLINSRGERVTAKRLGEVLRSHGCEYVKMNVNVDGERTTRSVWRVPPAGEFIAPKYEES